MPLQHVYIAYETFYAGHSNLIAEADRNDRTAKQQGATLLQRLVSTHPIHRTSPSSVIRNINYTTKRQLNIACMKHNSLGAHQDILQSLQLLSFLCMPLYQ